MIITCETCGTSFRLKSSMVSDSGSKVRCSKCQHVFIVYPPSATPDSSSAYPPGKGYEDDISPGIFGADEEVAQTREIDRSDMMEGETITDLEALRDADKQAARMKEGDTISDLEAMIDEDVTELTRDVSETGSLFDEESPVLGASDEPEISLSDLEAGPDTEIVSLEDLEAESESGELVDLDELTGTAEAPGIMDETGEIDFEDMARTTTEDEDIFGETEIEEAPFEETSELDETSEIDFEDVTKTTEDEELFGESEIEEPPFEETSEMESVSEVDLDDMTRTTTEDDELFEETEFVAEGTEPPELQPQSEDVWAEPEEPEKEMEGGFDTELEDFEVGKEPEEEKSSDSADKKTGDKKKAPPDEKASEESPSMATEDFELDFEDELEKALGEEEGEEEEAFDLDLDFEETPETAESKSDELEEFDLDFEAELDEGAPDAGEKVEAGGEAEEEFDLDLDLDLDESPEKAEAESGELEEFDLDFESELDEGEPVTETADEDDLGLDLELDEFDDLDLETGDEEGTVDLEEEDFDLDLDLGPEEEADETVDEGDEEFDLDLDFESEDEQAPASAEAEEDFELDLDLTPEGEEEAAGVSDEEFDLDLDLEPESEEKTVEYELDLESEEAPEGAASDEEFDLDLDLEPEAEAAEAPSGGETAKTEEFDLSEIEDFLEEEAPATESTETMEDSAELDLDLATASEGQTMEPETETAEADLDLETMLDEEEEAKFGDEKEISLETVDEQEAPEETEYAPETAAAAAVTGEAVEEFPEETEPEPVAPVSEPTFARTRKSRVKPVLITAIILIVLGAIAVGGYMFFFGEKEPAVIDQGNLQIEMIPNPDYRFVNNEAAGELLVVTGDVTNRYDQPRSFIQVKANLFNPAGQVIRSETAFAGNMIADPDLSSQTLENLNTQLANRRGDNDANVAVAPGQSVPFMVVFGNLPENMSEFNVEVTTSAAE